MKNDSIEFCNEWREIMGKIANESKDKMRDSWMEKTAKNMSSNILL